MPEIKFRLYISGKTGRSERTIANLRRILDEMAGAEYELAVCDVLVDPQAAENEKILATPTLVLTSPPPARRFVGDLFDAAKILPYLDVSFRAKGE